MARRVNYLNNKDILKEIHKSKSTFCSFVDPEYNQFDVILLSVDKVNRLTIAEAKRNKAKFIFASTAGAETPNNVYCYSKLLMEQYIIDNYDDYIILRIPRVYDRSRKKGLMKKLRLGSVLENDMSNTIKYITIDSFLEQTLSITGHKNIIYNYNNIQTDNIHEIRNKFI